MAANQWHREGEEMIRPRQAQERVGNGEGGLEEGGSLYREGRTVLLESINQTSHRLVNWDKRSRTQEGADRN